MDNLNKIACLYVSSLRALANIVQHNHWTTKGVNFYGNHLLFERIYEDILEDLDNAAEKFIGIFGTEYLKYDLFNSLVSKVMSKYSDLEGSPIEMILKIEKDFLKLSKDVFKSFEDGDKLTLGMDDFLMSVASRHEKNVYLLQQVLK